MRDTNNEHTFSPQWITISTLSGLELVLAEELVQLGIEPIQIGSQVVRCSGDLSVVYRLNLSVRTGLRVLWEVHRAVVSSNQDLYREANRIPWESFIDSDKTISVTFTSLPLGWISPKYAPLLVKDAVADRFTQRCGKRPSVDTHTPHLPIHLHIDGNEATFSVDTSGESLHRRGYRIEKTEAPLSEVLAAGILKLIGWHPGVPLYDPMCGSGTFLIEAGLMGCNIPPGLLRKRFAFQNWKLFDRELYDRIRNGLRESISANKTTHPLILYGSDKDPNALQIAQRNLERAGLDGKVTLRIAKFGEYLPPQFSEQRGIFLMNPPYGKRLQDPSIVALYQSIGNTLKQRYPGTQAWIFSGNPEGLKHIGLRPFKKYSLKNGPLDCKLVGFNIVAGSYGTRPAEP
ncbi:MAG: THUMP domain-containing protein [Spirochaetes bacterium]|nr:THUMP domain-containing protein [Spirochaetota bacterium]